MNSRGIETLLGSDAFRVDLKRWVRGQVQAEARKVANHLVEHPKDLKAIQHLAYLLSPEYSRTLSTKTHKTLVERRAKQLIILGWTPDDLPPCLRYITSTERHAQKLYEAGYRGLTLRDIKSNFAWMLDVQARITEDPEVLIFSIEGQDLVRITKNPEEVRAHATALVELELGDRGDWQQRAILRDYWRLGQDCYPGRPSKPY